MGYVEILRSTSRPGDRICSKKKRKKRERRGPFLGTASAADGASAVGRGRHKGFFFLGDTNMERKVHSQTVMACEHFRTCTGEHVPGRRGGQLDSPGEEMTENRTGLALHTCYHT